MKKDYFKFASFEDLQVGDVFKFSPIIDNDIPSKYYTAFVKDELNTTFNSTYGKELNTSKFPNNTPREIMIFPNRKK
jgi:hypothetical protein